MNFGDGVVGAIIDWTVWVCTAGVAQRGEITAVEGNSLSLRQLPREGAVYYGTHVVGKSFRPQNSFLCLTILALRQKAPTRRPCRPRAVSRRRRETEGVALGRSISPRCAPRNTKKYLLSKPPHSPTYSTREKKIQKPAKNFKKRLDKRR